MAARSCTCVSRGATPSASRSSPRREGHEDAARIADAPRADSQRRAVTRRRPATGGRPVPGRPPGEGSLRLVRRAVRGDRRASGPVRARRVHCRGALHGRGAGLPLVVLHEGAQAHPAGEGEAVTVSTQLGRCSGNVTRGIFRAAMRPQLSIVTHWRARWPIVLLLASIGVTAVAGLNAVRVSRSNRAVADRALREYASFAAWSYGQHLEDALRTMAQEAIGAVNHGEALHTYPTVPTASDLARYLPWNDRCYCHRPLYGPVPETFFGFEIAHEVLESAVNTHADPSEGWELDQPLAGRVSPDRFTAYARADRSMVLRTVRDRAREQSSRAHVYTYLVLPLAQGPRLLVYTLMPTSRGDTMVYGAQYTPAAVAKVMGWMMDDAELLPESFRAGRENRDLIAVTVAAPDGGTFFASGTMAPSAASATARLSPRYGSLVVHAAIRPDQVGSLLVGGLPRSRLPFLLGLLLLAAA